MTEHEINLSELFGDNNMEMQSSTIYRALRGEGMRVTPLVGNKVNAVSQRVVVPSHMVVSGLKQSKPNSVSTERSFAKTAYVGKIFDLRANGSKEGVSKGSAHVHPSTSSEPATKVHLKAPTSTKVVMEFKRRDVVTPRSASSIQRVPFTSTKLEKQVSRETLREDESEKKPKPQKKVAADKRVGRRTSLTSRDPSKLTFISPRPRISSNLPQRLSLYKHRKVKVSNRNKTVANIAETGRNAPEQPKTVQKTVPGSAPKEKLRTPLGFPPGSAQKLPSRSIKKAPGSAHHSLAPSQKTLPAKSRKGFPLKAEPRKTVGTAKTAPASSHTTGGVGRKKLWIPSSEGVESWNQYCPVSKARAARRKKTIKRRPIVFEGDKSATSRSGGSESEDDTDSSTEIDEEERRRLRELEIRREMKQKSVEFFNQFKYGEILRKVIPRMRYNAETRPDQTSDTRLSDVEVKIRLSRLDESACRISELMPKWSAMLMTTREANRVEQIRKTLTNAQHVLDRKVDRAKEMLVKYIDTSGEALPAEEMEDIKRHSELVQLDMNSLERMFAAHEKQLADELDEPTSISP